MQFLYNFKYRFIKAFFMLKLFLFLLFVFAILIICYNNTHAFDFKIPFVSSVFFSPAYIWIVFSYPCWKLILYFFSSISKSSIIHSNNVSLNKAKKENVKPSNFS